MQLSLEMLSATPPTAGGGIARLALTRAAGAGIDPAPIALAAGLTLDRVENPKARISVPSQIAVLNLVADALHDEVLGFHLAEHFDLREIGLLYYVLASSATLGEALARIERYSTVTNEGLQVECRHLGHVSVHLRYVGVPRHADRHQMEFMITALLRVFRRLTETELKPTRVRLAHPRCAKSSRIETFFGCKIEFAAESDEVVFARGALQLPLLEADSRLNEISHGVLRGGTGPQKDTRQPAQGQRRKRHCPASAPR